MSASRVLLADQDLEYGKALARAVSNLHNEFEMTVTQFERSRGRNPENRIDYNQYDLILFSGYPEETAQSFRADENRRNIVLLTEYPVQSIVTQSEQEGCQIWYLYKYQDISLILSDLNFLMGFLTGKTSLLKKSSAPELIGFFSISGGSGKTVIALSASRELARYHDKRILYLSLEDLPATELFIKSHSQCRNIGDYLYFLFEKQNINLCRRLESFTVADEFGVETFLPTSGRNDLNALTQEEIIQLIKVISDSCRYDYIALDLKSDLSSETTHLLKLCSRIILIQNHDPVSRFKNRKLAAYWNFSEEGKTKSRFIMVVNKASSPEPEPNDDETGNFKYIKKIHTERDDCSFQSGWNYLNIDISNAFGIGIKKLADEILSAEFSRQYGG